MGVTVFLTLSAWLLGQAPPGDGVRLGLDEALELAVMQSHAMKSAQLNAQSAQSQVDQAWGQAFPRVDLSASYTRNIKQPNPFAGSNALSMLSGGAATPWLQYNESARLDGDPQTQPLSLQDFMARQQAAAASAGYAPDPDANPFMVENQFQVALVLTQTLYNGAVFDGIRAAKVVDRMARLGVAREAQRVVKQTGEAFYGALLLRERRKVLENSVTRIENTVGEVRSRVERGILPQLNLLSAEVELANLKSMQLQAERAEAAAHDGLAILLGMPPGTHLELVGELNPKDLPDLKLLGESEALGEAYTRRPDLLQLEKQIEALRIQESATRAGYLPSIKAVLQLAYVGSVPDDRDSFENPGGDPFRYQRHSRGLFDKSYWGGAASVGVQLNWNLFDGFSTGASVDKDRFQTEQVEVQAALLRDQIRFEVQEAYRRLRTAKEQLAIQAQNVSRAELSYQHAEARVKEGVSSSFDLRSVSQQLDESRFQELQAVHDLQVAKLQYNVAIGQPVDLPEEAH